MKKLHPDKEVDAKNHKPFLDLGFGWGINYGGFLGLKVSFVPISRIALFGAIGTYFSKIGWNTGINLYILEKSDKNIFRPYLNASYGVNGYLHIQYGYSEGMTFGNYDAFYNSFSLGVGTEVRYGKSRNNGPNIHIGYIFPNDKMQNDLKSTQSAYITYKEQSNAIIFSIGYHFEI